MGAITWQGVLTDKSGNSVVDGEYSADVALYSQKEGGNPLWSKALKLSVMTLKS